MNKLGLGFFFMQECSCDAKTRNDLNAGHVMSFK